MMTLRDAIREMVRRCQMSGLYRGDRWEHLKADRYSFRAAMGAEAYRVTQYADSSTRAKAAARIIYETPYGVWLSATRSVWATL